MVTLVEAPTYVPGSRVGPVGPKGKPVSRVRVKQAETIDETAIQKIFKLVNFSLGITSTFVVVSLRIFKIYWTMGHFNEFKIQVGLLFAQKREILSYGISYGL